MRYFTDNNSETHISKSLKPYIKYLFNKQYILIFLTQTKLWKN